MSKPEVLLWQRLRGAPQGIRFRRQHPIDPYVVDFYCSAARLVVEIDGAAHDAGDRPQYDERREQILCAKGYRLVRIPAVTVLQNADAVAEGIIAMARSPLHHASHGPPPRAGEDR